MSFFMLGNQMYNLDLVFEISLDDENGMVEMFFLNGFKVAIVHEEFSENYDLENYEGIAYILDPADFEDYLGMLAGLVGNLEELEAEEPSGEEIKEEPEESKESEENETGETEEGEESEA